MPVLPVSQRGYAHPELLAETDWLSQRLDDASLRIIDTRAAEQYAAGHIPGALHLAAFGAIPRLANGDMGDPEDFEKLVGGLGISNNTTVVTYDAPGPAAGMVAWAFLYFGHPNVRMLDGGFDKWSREGRPVTRDTSSYKPAAFKAAPVEAVYCSYDHARAAYQQPRVVFWDTRSMAEYEGTAPAAATIPRPGHIPGAAHLEWVELLDPAAKTLKPAREMQALLVSKGITPESEVLSY